MERCRARLRFYDVRKYWIAALIAATPIAAATANIAPFGRTPPYLPVPKGAAVIMNTGSTNTTGYRIVVQRSGATEYVAGSRRATTVISTTLAEKVFADLKAAMPLHELGHVLCMKSASFGTSLFIYWDHERSPDLSCAADAPGRALFDDASVIAQALHIAGSFRQPVIRPMLPNEQHKPLPTPTPM